MKWFKRRARRKKSAEWHAMVYETSLFTAKMLLSIVLLAVLIMFFSVRYVQLESNDSTAETYQEAKNYLLGR